MPYEKVGKNESVCIADEVPFEIPESWEWAKIETISMPIGNKNNQIQSKEVLPTGKIPVVSQGKDLIDGYCNDVSKKIDVLPLVMFGNHTRNVKYIDFEFVIGADGTKFHKKYCRVIPSIFITGCFTLQKHLGIEDTHVTIHSLKNASFLCHRCRSKRV